MKTQSTGLACALLPKAAMTRWLRATLTLAVIFAMTAGTAWAGRGTAPARDSAAVVKARQKLAHKQARTRNLRQVRNEALAAANKPYQAPSLFRQLFFFQSALETSVAQVKSIMSARSRVTRTNRLIETSERQERSAAHELAAAKRMAR